MPITRRDFVQQAGLALASGVVAGCQTVPAKPPASSMTSVAGVPCDTSHEFENWSHTIEFRPERFCKPTSQAEVVALVTNAIGKRHVRTQGAGHSFAQLVVT